MQAKRVKQSYVFHSYLLEAGHRHKNVDAALPARVYWVGYVNGSAMFPRAKLTGKPMQVNEELQLF